MLKSKKVLIIWRTTPFKRILVPPKWVQICMISVLHPFLPDLFQIQQSAYCNPKIRQIDSPYKNRKKMFDTLKSCLHKWKSLHFEMFFTNHDLYINSVFQNPTIKRKEWFMFIFSWKAASPIFRFIFISLCWYWNVDHGPLIPKSPYVYLCTDTNRKQFYEISSSGSKRSNN